MRKNLDAVRAAVRRTQQSQLMQKIEPAQASLVALTELCAALVAQVESLQAIIAADARPSGHRT